MRLVDLSTTLQNYCHAGKSLDRVVIEYEGNHLALDRVEVKSGYDEESIVIELKKEETNWFGEPIDNSYLKGGPAKQDW